MAILLTEQTRAVIHGIGGQYSRQQLPTMLAAKTAIVAGVSLGQGGAPVLGIPTFDTMAEAVRDSGANTSLLYIPASGLYDAVAESVDAGVKLIVAAAEHAPLQDGMRAAAYARRAGAWLIGPNSLGLVSPGHGMLGSYSLDYAVPGPVGIISRSGSISVSVSRLLTQAGLGHSTCAHIGGDTICGRNPLDYARAFAEDPHTDVIVYCGEVGGAKEYDLADGLATIRKPLVALVLGRAAQPEKRLGHAGALVSSARDTADAKRAALAAAGAHVADNFSQLVELCRSLVPASLGGRVAPAVPSAA